MRGENQAILGQARVIEDFRRVAVREQVVRLEIFVDLDELQVPPGFLACPAGARLAIADHTATVSDPVGLGQRAKREDHTGRVAARIGDDARFGDFGGVELWETVDRFAEPTGVRRGQLVPGLECFDVPEPEGPAEINDADSGFRERGSDFRGRFVRGGQKRGARAARKRNCSSWCCAEFERPNAWPWFETRRLRPRSSPRGGI